MMDIADLSPSVFDYSRTYVAETKFTNMLDDDMAVIDIMNTFIEQGDSINRLIMGTLLPINFQLAVNKEVELIDSTLIVTLTYKPLCDGGS